jgi:hypothetical protein
LFTQILCEYYGPWRRKPTDQLWNFLPEYGCGMRVAYPLGDTGSRDPRSGWPRNAGVLLGGHPWIRPFLDGQRFELETIRVMGIAFEIARAALRVANRDDLTNEQLLANRIIELAKTGLLDPEALCDGALKRAAKVRRNRRCVPRV